MNTLGAVVEPVARWLVDTVRMVTRYRFSASGAGLLAAVLLGGGYILVSALQVNPARSTIAVRVLLPDSGGLLVDQDVTLRGVPIGRVTSVRPSGSGVEAIARIDADARIPSGSPVRVSGLSAAGEQYLDFRPVVDSGPSLADGATVGEEHTSVPISLAELLTHADGTMAQLDPTKLAAVMDELRVSSQGPQKLAAIFDGGALLVSTLDSVLPQTVSLLRTSRIVLTTTADGSDGLQNTSQNFQEILRGVNAMDGGFRNLVDNGSDQLTAVDNLIADNSDTMVQLLGNLTTVSQVAYSHVPALSELFADRGSAMEAIQTIFHDGAVWATVDIYPRYTCDYNLPRRPPAVPDFPEPFMYTYCDNPDPAVLIRGARNAPRPPGDDTAGPPPGYDPLQLAGPTPVGKWTIPTPYGGPDLPLPMPTG